MLPLNSMEEALDARNQVLTRMLDENYLTAGEAESLTALPITVAPGHVEGVTGYVQAEVRSKLIDLLGYEQTTGGGYRVFTTVDSELQTVAEKALRDQLSRVELETPNYKHETPAKYKERLQASLSTGKTVDDKDCPRPTYLPGAVIMTDSPDWSDPQHGRRARFQPQPV